MICFKTLKLSGFRNFDDEIIPLHPGTNIILGENGHGKSNLLEAIYLICTGKSFRTSHNREMIGLDKPGFLLEATLYKQNIEHHVAIEFYQNKKKLSIYNTSYQNLHPLMGFLPVVILTPEMKKIIDGGPIERRKFIDFLASQLSRPYFEAITRYHKALKQRNAALKAKQQTNIWEQIMAVEWLAINKKREQFISRLETLASSHLQADPLLKASCNLIYKPSSKDKTSLDSVDAILAFYKKTKAYDIHAHTSLYGPHRDDFDILLNGSIASQTASEGQKKMLVAALCLASFDLLKETLKIDPLFLIDDYDAHFDLIRKDWIRDQLKPLSQSFLTSPLDDLSNQKGTFYISQGKVLDALPV